MATKINGNGATSTRVNAIQEAIVGLDRLFAAVEDHTAALIQLIEHGSDEEAVSRIIASRAALLNAIVWLLRILMLALAEQDTEAALLRKALDEVNEKVDVEFTPV